MKSVKMHAGAALLVLVFCVPLYAQDGDIENLNRLLESDRMIVLDYSGSMRERGLPLDLQRYPDALDAAIKLTRTAADVNVNASSGLLVFGHQLGAVRRNSSSGPTREESCKDINIEIPFSKHGTGRQRDIDEVEARLKRVSPGGETPLTNSITGAARELRNGGSIVLFTDLDKSTCQGFNDPCAEIRQLKDSLLKKFKIYLTHVVAVQASNSTNMTPRELASCSGAKALVLEGNVDEIVDTINKDLKEASLPVTLSLSVRYNRPPVIQAANISSDSVNQVLQIVGQGWQQEQTLPKHQVPLKLAPGDIELSATIGSEVVKAELNGLMRGKDYSANLVLNPTPVRVTLVGPEGRQIPANTPVQWSIEAGDQRVAISGRAVQTFNMLAFKHKITASLSGGVCVNRCFTFGAWSSGINKFGIE